MLISNLRYLNKTREISIRPDLSTNLEDQFTAKFLLILEEVFTQKQSDKFNNHYSLESVADIFQKGNDALLNLPVRTNQASSTTVTGSDNDLLNSLTIHIGMIYDLGCAFHSKMYILKEQIVDILTGAFGGPVDLSANSIFVNVSGKLDVSNEKLREKVKLLFQYIQKEKIDYEVISSLNLPHVNYRKVWINHKTLEVAKLTREFYKNESLVLDSKSEDRTDLITLKLNAEKLIGLSNLLNASLVNDNSSKEIFREVLSSFDWPESEMDFLANSLKSIKNDSTLNIEFLEDHDQAFNCCLNMIILAKRNKEIDRGERLFIYSYAKKIGIDHHRIDNFLL